MENNLLVSIIVPVYKVERYLPRCIESILGQTYTNFELILVDDGTPDKSGIICDRYAEKDSRIKVIHKENGGVSSARNAGIDAAQGEWITFIDSDDWVSDDYLEVLLQPLEKHNCELTVGSMERRHIRISTSRSEEHFIDVNTQDTEKIIELIDRTEFYGPCMKLFARNLIKTNKLRFPEGILMAEDAIFVNNYLKFCRKIYLTGKVIYYYNELNAISVTRHSRYFEELPMWSVKYIESYKDVLDEFGIIEPYKARELQNKALSGYILCLKLIVLNFDEIEAKKRINKLYKYYEEWMDYDYHLDELQTDKQCELIKKIRSGNVDVIYQSVEIPRRKSFYSRVKGLAKRIIANYLEKHRDGLNRHKI